MEIEISGLEIAARHGVLESEKIQPQPFVFDILLDVDFTQAAVDDDLGATVNYAEVCATVREVVLAESYNLIESLARECALAILERFRRVNAVTVTVSKPQAPVAEKFRNIGVTFRAERNEVILSLGSSLGDKRAALDGAVAALGDVRGVTVEKVSDYIETQPYGGVARQPFLNAAVLIECLLSPRELLGHIHRIERSLGRVRAERWGDRTADIDIVFFGSKIIAEAGLIVPHADYMNRDFVLIPAKQIAPDFVCPLRRRMLKDL